MGALKIICAVALLLATAAPSSVPESLGAPPNACPERSRRAVFVGWGLSDSHSLFAQSAARLLARDFSRAAISYLLLDANTGAVLASRWDDLDTPVPVGSLVKPFTALAYGSAHAYRYPQHVCRAGQCWLPRGHGRQGLISATANSCNAYFAALAARVTAEQIAAIARDFLLDPPASDAAASLIGKGQEWRLPPLALARAYAELSRRRAQPGIADIVAGMRRSAISGTGAAVGRRLARSAALVKTGTAECAHHPRGAADGFVVALFPADEPTILLLLRVHGTTGAHAAETAGQVLHALEEQPSVAD